VTGRGVTAAHRSTRRDRPAGSSDPGRPSADVLVDDDGESIGLRLSRAEAQDLHRSLVTWLAHTGRSRLP
jgi:hypothetical protein